MTIKYYVRDLHSGRVTHLDEGVESIETFMKKDDFARYALFRELPNNGGGQHVPWLDALEIKSKTLDNQ